MKEKIFQKFNLEDAIWIETGTHYGDTTKFLSRFSKKVFTLEPSSEIFYEASKILESYLNIELINKTSEEGLEEIILNLDNGSNVCFWLDGHYSEGNTF